MKKIIVRVICCVLFTLGAALIILTNWYAALYDTSFSGLLFTVTTPMKGAGAGTTKDILLGVMPKLLAALAVYTALLTLCSARRKRLPEAERKHRRWKAAEWCLLWAGLAVFLGSVGHAWARLHVTEYIRNVSSQTTLYEDHYVAPDSVVITRPEKKPNIIWLFLESMETTYASTEDGGIQPVNYMPNLTALARENVSFSNTDKLGGFLSLEKTNWTMAAMFGATSGLPFGFPVGQNSMNKYASFAPEVITMGDLLAEDGYAQEFLCGSDAGYAGRSLYFTGHGEYAIYDLFTARANGELPSEDYYTWWGFEDHYLFAIAQKELARLWESGQPFNLTLLTVDAHHLGGYLCDWCGDEYEDKTANVIACTDRQVMDFVTWCTEQPFWEETVMVICGDHPRMDTCLTEGVPYQQRAVYNCFLNARAEPEGETRFRTASVMDLFPTVLAAMGYRIEGDRLGLGTNLFSGRETLAEEMGYDALNAEVQKYSRYFVNHFAR